MLHRASDQPWSLGVPQSPLCNHHPSQKQLLAQAQPNPAGAEGMRHTLWPTAGLSHPGNLVFFPKEFSLKPVFEAQAGVQPRARPDGPIALRKRSLSPGERPEPGLRSSTCPSLQVALPQTCPPPSPPRSSQKVSERTWRQKSEAKAGSCER